MSETAIRYTLPSAFLLYLGARFWYICGFQLHATEIRYKQGAGGEAGDPVSGEPGFWPKIEITSDFACVVYRISQSLYRPLFETVWGKQAFAIRWPDNVEKVCSIPGPPPASDPFPVHLSEVDRGLASVTYDQFQMAVAAYEAGPEVSAFTSKFDYFLADVVKLTPEEQRGYDLFRGICVTAWVVRSQTS